MEVTWAGERGAERNSQPEKGGIPVEVFDNLYKQWYPSHFNAKEWVQTAKDAGCKYIIFISKHHDGFCLWDTKTTDYCVTGPESPWKVDVLKKIADACHKLDVKLVVYFSIADWYNPDAFNLVVHPRYIEFVHNQLREICTNYGRIDGIWFDLGSYVDKKTRETIVTPAFYDAEKLFAMLHELQSGIIMNNRTGLRGDFSTPEQRLGGFENEKKWEACVTLGTRWGWKPNDVLKSKRQVIYLMVQAAGGNGNLALNTNPMPDGRIEPRQAERFKEVGNWLKENGESIYGTPGGPYKPGTWGASTHKDNKIYLHILNWTKTDQQIDLPAINIKIKKSYLIHGEKVEYNQTPEKISIKLGNGQTNNLDDIIVIELDGDASQITPIDVPIQSLANRKNAYSPSDAPNRWHTHGADWANDGDFASTWWCKGENSWMEIDLEKPTLISKVLIFESSNNIQKFNLQFLQGNDWENFYEGNSIGDKLEIAVKPFTAQKVRFNILESTDSPNIAEILLF